MTPPPRPLLIRRAELLDGRLADVLVRGGVIAAVGAGLAVDAATVIDAGGALLLPGLHDHHIHLAATAASLASIRCGPPEVRDAAALAAALGGPGTGWLRGIGYHESVTGGVIDRHWLDRVVPGRPARVQHRSGRLWIFNSPGLDALLASGLPPPPGLERQASEYTGRLYDEDGWLRRALGGAPPAFAAVGAALAGHGVTGVTDMTPGNDDAMAAHFAREQARGALPQRVTLAGRLALSGGGPVKLHLHEARLPALDETVATIRAAHAEGRAVAVHCVTEVELVFTLAAFGEAQVRPGDRIEHAAVTPDALLAEIAALGLAVVVQPHFVAERGDAYLADIPAAEWRHLYRLRAFLKTGVALAAGSDAPFGGADPWAAMEAAVSRRTAGGRPLGLEEARPPEQALALFLADPADLRRTRVLATGAPADLCLLTRPWSELRRALDAAAVRATIIGGRLVHDRVDQPPAERRHRAEAPA